MIKLLKMAAFVVLFLFYPLAANACNVRSYAKAYVNKIGDVVGGKKPAIVIEKGIDDSRSGFYEDGVIHIFKGDYTELCIEDVPFLKSVIAHEYAHHLENKLKKVLNLHGERLAYVGEHAIGDEILGDAFYDNDIKRSDIAAYDKLKEMLKTKKIKSNSIQEDGVIFMKAKK